MLTLLDITNYQSLRHLRLKLGRFTVITGPTGAGKSAIIRAVRLCAFNARGTSYITRDQKSCQVMLEDAHGAKITIQRGARGADAYFTEHLVPVPAGGYGPVGAKFTKLGGQVPPQVSELLRLSDLNFAGQFDAPFLLSASGGDIARRLGELTNVTLVFAAAAEANRRKLRIAQQLRDREEQLAQLRERAQQYASLPARLAAISRAEQAAQRLAEVSTASERLRALLDKAREYTGADRAAAAAIARWSVPDAAAAFEAARRVQRLRQLLADWDSARLLRDQAAASAEHAEASCASYRSRLREALLAAGQCPTCGQPVVAGPG